MWEFPWDGLRLYWTHSLGWKVCRQLEPDSTWKPIGAEWQPTIPKSHTWWYYQQHLIKRHLRLWVTVLVLFSHQTSQIFPFHQPDVKLTQFMRDVTQFPRTALHSQNLKVGCLASKLIIISQNANDNISARFPALCQALWARPSWGVDGDSSSSLLCPLLSCFRGLASA